MKPIIKATLTIFLICFIPTVSFSQKNQIDKANKEFDRFSYIDARNIYLKVVEDGYTSAEIFKKLGDTYYFNSDYDNAAKWYTKLVDQFPGKAEARYYYRAAQSLKSLKKYEKSDSLMQIYAKIDPGKGGFIIQNFKEDPDYLKSIAFDAKGFRLEKVEINSELSDFGPSYYLDKLVYTTSTTNTEGAKIAQWNDQPFLDLYVADMDAQGKLSNPKALSGEINTKYHESSSTFTKDGKTVYFTRNNFIDGKKGKDENKVIRLKLYRATNVNGNWTNIVELPFNSDEYSTAHPSLSPDGKKLYFASDMPGTIGLSDLWYVDILQDNKYGKPVNLGSSINTEARDSFPFISDKNNLYFSSDGRSGLGGFDIFLTPLDTSGKPGRVTNLGEPANSSQDDFGFIIKEDKKIGFLSSNRDGERGSIDDEIYRVIDICAINLTGTVFDVDTQELLPGAKVSLLDANNTLVETITVGEDATYSFSVDCDSQFSIRGDFQSYAPNEKIVETPAKTGSITVPLPLKLVDPCPPNDLGCRLSLQPIYFDFDRFNIRPDASIELAKIFAAMREYPELIIHIESHTDSRGPDSYNEALSEKRAQSTLEWLVSKGIDRKRLSAKGYGENKLVNQCTNGVECTEEQHQLNRRSMFIIQN